MIIRVTDFYILSCDTCKTSVTQHFRPWDQALDYIKQNGWKVLIDQERHEFKHVCPNCQGGYNHG